jgi:hypothetical protein
VEFGFFLPASVFAVPQLPSPCDRCDQIIYIKSTKKQNKKSDNTDDILENIFPKDNLFQGSKSVGTQWRQVRITEGKRLFFQLLF